MNTIEATGGKSLQIWKAMKVPCMILQGRSAFRGIHRPIQAKH